MVLYYAQYVMALSMGCIRLCSERDTPKERRVTFIIGAIVHFYFLFCILFGVFNRHFANGGLQLVAYTVLNLYVYFLCIMNWPLKTFVREYPVEDEAEGL